MTVYAGYSVATIADLKAIPPSRREVYSGQTLCKFVTAKSTWYYFVPDSEETGNDDTIIEPDEGAGRWYMQKDNAASGGSGSGVSVQNGKPTNTPTAIGQAVADERGDRGVLWVATGTDSPDDWQAFGFRPISVPYSDPENDSVEADFDGQVFVSQSGNLYRAWIWIGDRWSLIYSFSNS